MLKIAIYTLGCKVNQADSQSIKEMFLKAGCEIVEPEEDADVYIINTCVVTNVGQKKSKQHINHFIANRPNSLLVVTGCYPQTAEEEVKALKGIDLIVGNQDRANLFNMVMEQVKHRQPQKINLVRDIGAAREFEQLPAGTSNDKTRAFLKIQEGCNQYCSYCIIPYARGPLRSRSLDDITAQVELLTEKGFKEVVLLGIHLGAYGKETGSTTTLYDAVKAALAVPALQRLRLGSLECIEIDDRLLDLIANEPRIAKHLHLPLQSGADSILRAMKRPYTTQEFATLVEKIRSKVPTISITTDVIVGFPGETEELFQDTYEFCKQLKFADIHIFPFSKRQGTPAETMPDQVTRRQKELRSDALRKLKSAMKNEFAKQFVGTEQAVLIEQVSKAGYSNGYTSNYIRVYVKLPTDSSNELVNVQILDNIHQDGINAKIID